MKSAADSHKREPVTSVHPSGYNTPSHCSVCVCGFFNVFHELIVSLSGFIRLGSWSLPFFVLSVSCGGFSFSPSSRCILGRWYTRWFLFHEMEQKKALFFWHKMRGSHTHTRPRCLKNIKGGRPGETISRLSSLRNVFADCWPKRDRYKFPRLIPFHLYMSMPDDADSRHESETVNTRLSHQLLVSLESLGCVIQGGGGKYSQGIDLIKSKSKNSIDLCKSF